MINFLNYQRCSQHNKTGLVLDVSQRSPNEIVNCKYCIIQQSKNILIIEDLQQQVKEILESIVQYKEQQKQNNILILKEIINLQLNFKSNVEAQINKNIIVLNKEIQNLNEQQIQFTNKVQETFNSGNYQKQYNILLELNPIDSHVRQLLDKQLQNLVLIQFKEKIEQQINQIQLNISEQIDKRIKTFEQQFIIRNQQTINCFDHNKQAQRVDLNTIMKTPNRFACEDCMDNNKTIYTSLKEFDEMYSEQKKYKQNLLEENKQNYQVQVEKIITILQKYRSSILEKLDKTLDQLNDNSNLYLDQLQNELSQQQKDRQILATRELIEIAHEISDPFSPEKFLQKIENQNQSEIKKCKETLKSTIDALLQHFFQFQKEGNLLGQNLGEFDFERIIMKKKKLEICSNIIQIKQKIQNSTIIKKAQQSQSQQSQIQQQQFSKSLTLENQKSKCKEYVQMTSIKQEQWCLAISFCDEPLLMIASSQEQIKVFQQIKVSQSQEFELIQTLTNHQLIVQCLKFMKKSVRFVSGGQDRLIMVWARDDQQKYICEQILNGHSYGVTCLDINKLGNFIISGSVDDKIKFWFFQEQWNPSKIYIDHKDKVEALSLSENEKLLVSCSNKLILVNQLLMQDNFKYQQIQKIDLQTYPIYRICFINNNIFAFQSSESKLSFYVQLNDSQEFKLGQEIQIQPNNNCFQSSPAIYIQENNVVIFKSGSIVYIIKRNNDEDFIIVQQIQQQTVEMAVAVSENAQYMAIWDKFSQQIKIRKLS